MVWVSKFLDPKNDFAFKRIFGSPRNQDILIHFINDMLQFEGDKTVVNVSLIKTVQDPEIASKKQSILDVLCADQAGRQYIIEMQVAKTEGFAKRAQYYAAKAYTQQLMEGEQYKQLKEIFFIAITDFIMCPDRPTYYSNHYLLESQYHRRELQDFSFTFLELPKFQKSIHELTNLIDKWAYFFKYAEVTKEEDLEKIIGQDQVMEKAYQELNRFGWSEIEINTYEQEEKRDRDAQAILAQKKAEGIAEGIIQGRVEGRAEGRAEGRTEGMIEAQRKERQSMLKRLQDKGFSEQEMLELTGWTPEEFVEIKQML